MKKITFILLILCSVLYFSGCGKTDSYSLPEYDHEALTALEKSITKEEKAQYDEIITTEVAVIGSDPEGIAAAVSSARNGMDTYLIDFGREQVGGLYTLGWLNMIDMNYTESGGSTSINQGIFAEVLAANENKTSFTIEKMTAIFNNLLKEAKVTVETNYDKDYKVLTENNTAKGIVLHQNGKTILLKAVKYIDSTQNADIIIEAGAEYYDGLEELGLKGQRGCDTLVFQLSGVDWNTVKSYLQNDDNPDTGADNASAWGYSEIKNCTISNDNIYMRGPNIGLQEDGTILLNGLQIFHMDIKDEGAMTAMRKEVITTLETEIIPYMQKNFSGWENAKLVAVAPEFYIRESNHIKTVQRLMGEDIFQSNFSQDFIASGSYPIDLQAREKGLYGIALYGTSPYGIPFGAMVSDKVQNVLVASKCAGYDCIAAGSARTVPVGMNLGEAAGASAAYAIVSSIDDFNSIAADSTLIDEIQSLLKTQNVNFNTYAQTATQKATAKSDFYEEISYLRGKGLLTCGYTNDYQLNETATRVSLNSIQYAMSSNSPYATPTIPTEILAEEGDITVENLPQILNLFLNSDCKTMKDFKTKDILSEKVFEELPETNGITNELFYGVIGDMIKYMEKSGTDFYAEAYQTTE